MTDAARALKLLARARPEQALPLLNDVTTAPPHLELAQAAVEALGEIRQAAAADLLDQVATRAPGKELRKAARRSLHRLRQLGVEPSVREPAPPAAPARPEGGIYGAYATMPDGAGTRDLLLGLVVPIRGRQMAAARINDQVGILRFLVTPMTRKQFEQYVGGLAGDEVGPVEIPVEWAQSLLQNALAANRVSGTPVPRDFQSFRAVLAEGPADAHPPIYAEISAAEVRLRPDLVESSAALLEMPEFGAWLLPVSELRPQAKEWIWAQDSPIALPPHVVQDRQRRALEAVVKEHLSGAAAKRLRRRLEELAWLYLRRGRGNDARRAVAAAVALGADAELPPQQHPFVWRLAELSLELAVRAERAAQTGA